MFLAAGSLVQETRRLLLSSSGYRGVKGVNGKFVKGVLGSLKETTPGGFDAYGVGSTPVDGLVDAVVELTFLVDSALFTELLVRIQRMDSWMLL